MPVCVECDKDKAETDFSFAGKYRFRYCKACNVVRVQTKYHGMSKEERTAHNKQGRGKAASPEARRKKYAEDPEHRAKSITASKAAYQKLRMQLFDIFGHECACCKEKELLFLELDHVNGGGNAHYRRTNPTTAYREIIKAGHSDEYQVLCSNCNKGRSRNGGVCPHKV